VFPERVIEFQSLFWWIEGWDSCVSSALALPTPCFNPCSGGLRAGTENAVPCVALCQLFQSLFWWIEGWDRAPSATQRSLSWFQSLFWWIEGWDRTYAAAKTTGHNVSILVLVD